MNKREMFTIYQQYDSADSDIHDRWFHWRLKQQNITTHDPNNEEEHDRWTKVLHSMPNFYQWKPTPEGTIKFFWEGGSETVPLNVFIKPEEVAPILTLLWHSNYYDGPMSGMATYNGRGVWFDYADETEYADRIYDVYELSDAELKLKTEQHQMFCDMVGYHCEHDPAKYAPFRMENNGQESFDQYQKMSESFERVDLSNKEPVMQVHWYEFEHWGRPK